MDIPAPPIPSITPWWPLIAFVLGAVFPAIWGVWLTARTKRFEEDSRKAALDTERRSQQAIEKHKLEVERSKQEYDLRKDFQNDLIEECQKLRAECENLRIANSELLGSAMEKDSMIRALTEENHALKADLSELKARVNVLEAHIRSLEDTRQSNRDDQHRDSQDS